jgi:SAM-dependent methyltransferase
VTEPDFLRDTRASYDTMVADYTAYVRAALAVVTWDRAMLAGFADVVRSHGGGPVADIGCGPGRIAAHLHTLGLDVFGVDLSPGMVAAARQEHPHLRFEVGSMTALDLPDASLAGLVAWYSIIHVPDDRLPEVFAGFHRVLAPGGHLLLAFQVGDEPVHRTDAWGRPVSLTFHRRPPDRVADLLSEAGLPVQLHLLRQPETYGDITERTPQAYLLSRRPPTPR